MSTQNYPLEMSARLPVNQGKTRRQRLFARELPKIKRRPSGRRSDRLRMASSHADIVVLQRERADALARGLEIGVHHRGCRHADRWLADAAPGSGAVGRNDD